MSHTTLMPPPNRPPSSHSHSPRRTPVPLLLEAFPVPPTHIPPHPAPPSAFNSPSAVYARPSSAASGRPPSAASGRPPSAASFTSISSNNPPPSRPPAAPLPPVPGPSPISEQETLLFLNSSVKSSRSCPSVYSNSSPRSSLSGGASMTGQCSGNSAGRRMSVASGRSVRSIASSNAGSFTSNVGSYTSTGGSYTSSSPSSGSLSAPATVAFPRSPSSPAMTYSISEEDPADLTTVDIGEISLSSSPVPLSDDETAHEHAPVVFPVRESDESLASIDMGDLPPDQDNEINHDLDALELHRAMRASRSRSEMHKRILRARSTSPASRARSSLSPSNSSSPAPAVPPLPTSHKYQPSPGPAPKTPAPRPDSPDISTILATTPRPRRTSSTPGSRSRSRPRTSMRRRVSEGVSRPDSGISVRVSRPPGGRGRAESPVLLAYMRNENWEEGRFVSDYGVPLEDGEKGAGTLEVCEDDGSDSDSSLDLHTPLPHLMLRHGLLSPNSKLLPGSSRATSPMTPSSPDARPGSMLSVNSTVGSVMTKSGVFKDDRDTPRRRVRHRDGKLLKAGMGLTTGLGWSDSEDEDAPSPLTRRISSLNLSRKASAASVGGVHPLSRSFSGEPVPRRTAAALVPRASLPHKRSEPGYISASSSFL
ncbi:hypothetical protein PLICRDRAFT_508762 [Plicaturopsis crispa FD-325 SS-3]|nr:hypothetical protein PLICRDRAFT_508762 [Plicaturopsis crispa FD-325 SS-3]